MKKIKNELLYEMSNVIRTLSIDAIQKARPSGAKGTFIKKISISSTMGAGININI